MKKLLITILVLGVLAFAWWTISPFFIDTVVDDALPTSIQKQLDRETSSTIMDTTSTISIRNASEEKTLEQPEEGYKTAVVHTKTSAQTSEPALIVPETFTIEYTPGHSASGAVRVIQTPSDGAIVRYENYNGTNGPDLYVYLTNDLDADEFISLGRAKGNQGNINYSVPDDVDVDEYKYVVTWCKAFGVLFDYAEIQ